MVVAGMVFWCLGVITQHWRYGNKNMVSTQTIGLNAKHFQGFFKNLSQDQDFRQCLVSCSILDHPLEGPGATNF